MDFKVIEEKDKKVFEYEVGKAWQDGYRNVGAFNAVVYDNELCYILPVFKIPVKLVSPIVGKGV